MLNDGIFQKKIWIIETHFSFVIPETTKLELKNLLLNDAVCEINKFQMYTSVISEIERKSEKSCFILNKKLVFNKNV